MHKFEPITSDHFLKIRGFLTDTKFVMGMEIHSTFCRISGFTPPTKPGGKPSEKYKSMITFGNIASLSSQ